MDQAESVADDVYRAVNEIDRPPFGIATVGAWDFHLPLGSSDA